VHILIGLGNPGKKYRLTRHNVGFLFLDYIANRLNIPFSPGKGDYFFSEGVIFNKEMILVKPTTFMNNSGLVLAHLKSYIKDDLNNLIIIYDDYYLPFGTIRFRPKGTDAGHNGLKSIIYHLESDVFPRLKIGIGTEFDNATGYVLSNFRDKEITDLPVIFDHAYNGIVNWIESGINSAMNGFNRNLQN
jgi:PTH1 family peptidyl-tRNA hydrolase